MTGEADTVTAELAGALRSSINGDGGWGYVHGKSSRIEPTCWAALALLDARAAENDSQLVGAALARVIAWQRADGLLADTPGAPVNLAFNGLAAVVILRALATGRADLPRLRQVAGSILSGIMGVRGNTYGTSEYLRQDNRLIGWPWIDGMFSWVEPTSWCLLAAKIAPALAAAAGATARIASAERVLIDRCCLSGGWNYGNSNVLGKELYPYVPTTAIALLALRDRPGQAEVARSLTWLSGNWRREPSAFAVSLALLAMQVHRSPASDLEQAVRALVSEAGPSISLASVAMRLYALTGSRHEYAAFAS